MIVYGSKSIHLKSTELPFACQNCSHDQRYMHVYRNFFTFFFIPVVPLRKQALVTCPNCKQEQTKKEFLNEFNADKDLKTIKDRLNSIIKEAKVPLYTYLTTLLTFILIFGFMGWVYHDNQQSSLYATANKNADFVYVHPLAIAAVDLDQFTEDDES